MKDKQKQELAKIIDIFLLANSQTNFLNTHLSSSTQQVHGSMQVEISSVYPVLLFSFPPIHRIKQFSSFLSLCFTRISIDSFRISVLLFQPINIPDDEHERTGRDREHARIVPSSSVPNPEVISDTKYVKKERRIDDDHMPSVSICRYVCSF